MNSLYLYATGPLMWLVTIVCIGGLLWRSVRYHLQSQTSSNGLAGTFPKTWAALSVLHFLLPLNRTARLNPWSTLAGFVLHIPLLALIFFLSAHVIMLEQGLGISWPTLPDSWADALTCAALAGLFFQTAKRLFHPVIRGLSEPGDLLILALVALPLATGFMAHRQWFDYNLIIILHVASGALLVALVPFTKLSHMIFFFISRSATGSDFGQRGVESW